MGLPWLYPRYSGELSFSFEFRNFQILSLISSTTRHSFMSILLKCQATLYFLKLLLELTSSFFSLGSSKMPGSVSICFAFVKVCFVAYNMLNFRDGSMNCSEEYVSLLGGMFCRYLLNPDDLNLFHSEISLLVLV